MDRMGVRRLVHYIRQRGVRQLSMSPLRAATLRTAHSVPSGTASASRQTLIDHYAHFNPSPMSIKQFLEFGKSLTVNGKDFCEKASFLFLRKELPVRLANIIKEIHLLPESLLSQPSTQIVQGWYEQSFSELIQYEQADPLDQAIIQRFTENLVKIRSRHNLVVETMAQGVVELNKGSADGLPLVDSVTRMSIQYFLDRFYMMRISIRMLITQHTILFGGETPVSTGHVGTIDPECDIPTVVEDAFASAQSLCETYYEKSPELRMTCINIVDKDAPLKIVYVPSHLYHISFELFKNAMRATCENGDLAVLPPIDVVVVKSAEDVTIKMSDLGGGIPQCNIPKLFEYMFSTAPAPVDDGGISVNAVPMAGYGYGLPLSRLYARYFHGDLQVYSVHGYGTDAVIYLKTLSESANELLPVFNKSVMKQYRATRSHGWSSNNSKFSHLVEWG